VTVFAAAGLADDAHVSQQLTVGSTPSTACTTPSVAKWAFGPPVSDPALCEAVDIAGDPKRPAAMRAFLFALIDASVVGGGKLI
jgi:hypothetical protein